MSFLGIADAAQRWATYASQTASSAKEKASQTVEVASAAGLSAIQHLKESCFGFLPPSEPQEGPEAPHSPRSPRRADPSDQEETKEGDPVSALSPFYDPHRALEQEETKEGDPVSALSPFCSPYSSEPGEAALRRRKLLNSLQGSGCQ